MTRTEEEEDDDVPDFKTLSSALIHFFSEIVLSHQNLTYLHATLSFLCAITLAHHDFFRREDETKAYGQSWS
jgi:hypothetical protein